MPSFPTIQIRQTFAKLGINSQQARLHIEQPPPKVEMRTTHLKLDIESPHGELVIDQSKAWDALGIGNNLQWALRNYDHAYQLGLQGIGRVAANGDRLAAIHLGGNALADIAREEARRPHPFQYTTRASNDNVSISYRARKPDIRVIDGTVDLQVEPQQPRYRFERGFVRFRMLQYPSVQFIPPQIDIKA